MVDEFHMPRKMTNAFEVPKKSAFTLIELIFAIVIIGISVVSLPMMTQAVSKGIEGNLVQEAIFAASTELNQVISYQWDENAIDGSNLLTKVLSTPTENCTNRQGLINQPLHRRCLDDNTILPSTTLALDGVETITTADDMDDVIRTTPVTIFTGTAATSEGYKQNYNSSVNVTYANFGAVTIADQNMKKITVSIVDDANKTITLLNTYSANIGEIDYAKRNFQ